MKPVAISHKITTFSTRKHLLIAAGLSTAYLLPYVTVVFGQLLAKGSLLDQRLHFSAADVHHVLTDYGSQLRGQYLLGEYVDLLVAGVLLTVAMVISCGFTKRGWNTTWNLLPIIAGVLNAVKGGLFIAIIRSYPHESAGLVAVAQCVNIAKTIALAGSVVLLVLAVASLITPGRAQK